MLESDFAPFAAFPEILARIGWRKKRRLSAVFTYDYRELSAGPERAKLWEIVRGVATTSADLGLVERVVPTRATTFGHSSHGQCSHNGFYYAIVSQCAHCGWRDTYFVSWYYQRMVIFLQDDPDFRPARGQKCRIPVRCAHSPYGLEDLFDDPGSCLRQDGAAVNRQNRVVISRCSNW
jgi:hypothetical protein